MENDDLTETIKNKWLVILSELEKVSRVAWLAYYDSFPLKIENNVLVLGVSDRSKRMMASEEKHLNNFRKILLDEMNLDLSIEILFIEDEKLIEKIKNSIIIIPQTKINETKTSAPIAKMKKDKSFTPKINKASITNKSAGKPRNEIFSPGIIILTCVIIFGILFNIAMSLSNFIGDFSSGGGGSSYSGASNDSTESVPTQEVLCKNLKSDLNSYESRMNQISKDFKERNANIAKSDPSYGEALQEVPGLDSIWSDEQLWIKYKSEYKLILQENSYEARDDEISSYLNNIIEALSARIKFTQMQPSPAKGDLSDKLIGLDRDSFRAQSEINKICGSPLFAG